MTDRESGVNRRDQRRAVECLARLPGAPLVACGELQIATREIVANGVAVDSSGSASEAATFSPGLPIATTSSISWCKFAVRGGKGIVAPFGTIASAGLLKKNGGSRSGSCPSRARARHSCGRRNRCDGPGSVASGVISTERRAAEEVNRRTTHERLAGTRRGCESSSSSTSESPDRAAIRNPGTQPALGSFEARCAFRRSHLRSGLHGSMIDLYYWTTPNGHKITMFLEEAGLQYRIHPMNIGKGEQFQPEFLAISPNNRIPAIVDQAPQDGGAPMPVFESGAILIYLAEKSGSPLPSDWRGAAGSPSG